MSYCLSHKEQLNLKPVWCSLTCPVTLSFKANFLWHTGQIAFLTHLLFPIFEVLCDALLAAKVLCGTLLVADILCGPLLAAEVLCGAYLAAEVLCGALIEADILCGAIFLWVQLNNQEEQLVGFCTCCTHLHGKTIHLLYHCWTVEEENCVLM